jgi:hypothetical protein
MEGTTMLETTKMYIKETSLKNKNFNTFKHVETLIRNKELEKALAKKSFRDGKTILEDDHTDIDVLTCSESVIKTSLGNDAGQFIKDRDEIIALQNEVDKCLPLEDVTSLDMTDRVSVTLIAHAIYSSVVLDSDIFNPEKSGVDISNAISAYYKRGSMKDLKDALRPVFHKLLGQDGTNFYAVKTKKSDFAESDLRHFLASFGGSARRNSTKKKVDGETVTTWGNYVYNTKSSNKKLQASAFTTLCAVVLDNASKHTVIKPEESTPEETPATAEA